MLFKGTIGWASMSPRDPAEGAGGQELEWVLTLVMQMSEAKKDWEMTYARDMESSCRDQSTELEVISSTSAMQVL